MFLVFGVWDFYKTDLSVFNCDDEGALENRCLGIEGGGEKEEFSFTSLIFACLSLAFSKGKTWARRRLKSHRFLQTCTKEFSPYSFVFSLQLTATYQK